MIKWVLRSCTLLFWAIFGWLLFSLASGRSSVWIYLGLAAALLLGLLGSFVLGLESRIHRLSDRERYTDQDRIRYGNWLAGWVVPFIFNTKVEVKGLEYLDQVKTGALFPNHQSLMDIGALLKVVKRPHGFIAKKELDGIFLLSDGMRMIDCEFMDRQDVRQSVKVISNAVKKVKEGRLMVIFPEGTRAVKKEMGLFKAGSFKVATKAKADIIPVTFFNTHEFAKRWPRPTVVRMEIHPPIPFAEYENWSPQEIADRVEAIVKKNL